MQPRIQSGQPGGTILQRGAESLLLSFCLRDSTFLSLHQQITNAAKTPLHTVSQARQRPRGAQHNVQQPPDTASRASEGASPQPLKPRSSPRFAEYL